MSPAQQAEVSIGVPCATVGRQLLREPHPSPCALVIFGATGDLAQRKLMPALYNLALDGVLPPSMAILGTSTTRIPTSEFRARVRDALGRHSRRLPVDEAVWARFSEAIEFQSGDFGDPAAYAALKDRLAGLDGSRGTCGNRIFYLATPPDLFPVIVRQLHASGLLQAAGGGPASAWTRVVVEKPFGRDLESAVALDRLLATWLDESQTYRIDHYLGKETVQNLLVFRFGNAIFEPLWNRRYVDHVQITAAESIGIEGRGRFYEQTGVVRDVVQNHLLQVLALCAMEPPLSFGADDVRDAKVRLLKSLHPIGPDELVSGVVRGQYRGYREEPGVAPDSRVPTYLAMRVLVHDWRWEGVPFYLRAGKRLASRCTEVRVQFKPIPLSLFPREEGALPPNVLTLRIQPHEGISLRFVAKVPGDHLSVGNVRMDMTYAGAFGGLMRDAYERLLLDCMRGDATLYSRRDWVEEAWRYVTPLLQDWEEHRERQPAVYEPGSEGPAEAGRLLARDGRVWNALGPPPDGEAADGERPPGEG